MINKTTKIVDKLNKFNKMENIICNTAIVYHPPKQKMKKKNGKYKFLVSKI